MRKTRPVMIAPTIAYNLVISFMVFSALSYDLTSFSRPWVFASGAVLFMISDTALAINTLIKKFRGGNILVLATYYAAQTLITCGVLWGYLNWRAPLKLIFSVLGTSKNHISLTITETNVFIGLFSIDIICNGYYLADFSMECSQTVHTL